MLTFSTMRRANQNRLRESYPMRHKFDAAYWGNALAGETGEACNIIKKIINEREGITIEDLAKELADILAYLDLTAAYFGIDLEAAYIAKFNEVSERVGSIIRIDPDTGCTEIDESTTRR